MNKEEFSALPYWLFVKTFGRQIHESKIHICDQNFKISCGSKTKFYECQFDAFVKFNDDNTMTYATDASHSIYENIREMNLPISYFCEKSVRKLKEITQNDNIQRQQSDAEDTPKSVPRNNQDTTTKTQ